MLDLDGGHSFFRKLSILYCQLLTVHLLTSPSGPVHITTNETTAINADASTELTPKAFADCKERMRTVKKSLKHLDSQDPNLSEKEQLEQTRKYGVLVFAGVWFRLGDLTMGLFTFFARD